jgi:hypothetical protein
MAFSPLRLNTNTTFPNVLPLDFAGQENPYLISPELSGQFMGFDYDDEKEEEKDNDEPKEKPTTFQDFLMRSYQDAQDEKKYYRSDEYLSMVKSQLCTVTYIKDYQVKLHKLHSLNTLLHLRWSKGYETLIVD